MKNTMANGKLWLGMLVITLVFGMMITGCSSGGGGGGGGPGGNNPQSPSGDSPSNPMNRSETRDLGTMTYAASGWRQLLDSIESNGKYVNLDLSNCNMDGTSFNPDPSVSTGKNYIVSITLPTVATSIVSGSSNSAFNLFYTLKSVSGANIITIDDGTFSNNNTLQSVSLPKLTTIGNFAFSRCSELRSVNFPDVTTIGYYVFSYCSGLQNASFPKVTTIDSNVFANTGDTALTITMGSTAPALETKMFADISTIKTVTVKVPAGATSYTPFSGSSVTVSGQNTALNWVNGFRGGGWDGTTWASGGSTSDINPNITVIIQQQ